MKRSEGTGGGTRWWGATRLTSELPGWQQAIIIGLVLGAIGIVGRLSSGWDTFGAIAELSVMIVVALSIWAIARVGRLAFRFAHACYDRFSG